MIRYYCSGFDINNIFGHGLGEMLKSELKSTQNIVYISGSPEKVEKAKTKYIPLFSRHFADAGIEFQNVSLIEPSLSPKQAQSLVKNADFVMLMGGDPFAQKEMCEKLDIMHTLKTYDGIMMGFSAGAMLMSRYIIVTPCSEEYPDFRIERGLNLDGISIYPHNNTAEKEYPEEVVAGDETYKKSDLIKVAAEYGNFYLLQDNARENGATDVSIIKVSDGKIEFYTENEGKIWEVGKNVRLLTPEKTNSNRKMTGFAKQSREY